MTDRETAGAPGDPIVETHGLTKRFGGRSGLEDLDLEVRRGVSLAVLGPAASGKTTLIRLLSGLARPPAGTITALGARVGARQWLPARRRLGVVSSNPVFHAWMSGREVVDFAAHMAGLPARERRTRVDEALGLVGLRGVAAERVSTYSSGLRRRLGLAQAVAGRPDRVLLDEPLGALDPDDRSELLGALDAIRRAATIVFTTRSLADTELLADRVALLDGGRLVLEATIADLLDRLAQPIYAIEAERDQGAALSALNARLRQERWVAWTALEAAGIRVAVADPARAARDLLPVVLAAGVRVAAFGRRRPTLDDLLAELSGAHRTDGPEGRAA
ncbi:MAG: ABC transporter ATP-binding protein [Chloroflexi bacterium]|nr:ABC transporter ATP-binding protein [Chloroflexota bacterium]